MCVEGGYVMALVAADKVPDRFVMAWRHAVLSLKFNKGLCEYVECEYFYYEKRCEEYSEQPVSIEVWIHMPNIQLELR